MFLYLQFSRTLKPHGYNENTTINLTATHTHTKHHYLTIKKTLEISKTASTANLDFDHPKYDLAIVVFLE